MTRTNQYSVRARGPVVPCCRRRDSQFTTGIWAATEVEISTFRPIVSSKILHSIVQMTLFPPPAHTLSASQHGVVGFREAGALCVVVDEVQVGS